MLRIIILFFLFFTHLFSYDKVLFPPKLKKGDTIALILPCSALKDYDRDMFFSYVDKLKELGYGVYISSNMFEKYGSFAGDDDVRLSELMYCFKNPNIKAIWCVRGGYGSARLLNEIDYDLIRNNPKIFIGMSDVTALHLAINKFCNLVTFLGQHANITLNSIIKDNNHYMWNNLLSIIQEDNKDYCYEFSHIDESKKCVKTVSPGIAKGKTIGGNLTLIINSCGTPWQIETVNKILIIEDIGIKPYQLDRMLNQLKQCGLLQDVAGVIFGCFVGDEDIETENSYTIDEVIDNYFIDAKFPVIKNFPTGHLLREQVILPLNVNIELDGDNCRVRLLE
jgi:muramoyltetrapeptide carboxypeptidase